LNIEMAGSPEHVSRHHHAAVVVNKHVSTGHALDRRAEHGRAPATSGSSLLRISAPARLLIAAAAAALLWAAVFWALA
jgi:hypothetical protein